MKRNKTGGGRGTTRTADGRLILKGTSVQAADDSKELAAGPRHGLANWHDADPALSAEELERLKWEASIQKGYDKHRAKFVGAGRRRVQAAVSQKFSGADVDSVVLDPESYHVSGKGNGPLRDFDGDPMRGYAAIKIGDFSSQKETLTGTASVTVDDQQVVVDVEHTRWKSTRLFRSPKGEYTSFSYNGKPVDNTSQLRNALAANPS